MCRLVLFRKRMSPGVTEETRLHTPISPHLLLKASIQTDFAPRPMPIIDIFNRFGSPWETHYAWQVPERTAVPRFTLQDSARNTFMPASRPLSEDSSMVRVTMPAQKTCSSTGRKAHEAAVRGRRTRHARRGGGPIVGCRVDWAEARASRQSGNPGPAAHRQGRQPPQRVRKKFVHPCRFPHRLRKNGPHGRRHWF